MKDNTNGKKRYFLIGFIVVLIGIQFIQSDKSVPEYDNQNSLAKSQLASLEEVLPLLQDACYDCHSYETSYPFYAYIAPVSWWMQGHVRNGRKSLNFSTLYSADREEIQYKLYECAEEIEEGKMPPKGYVRMHSEASLSEADKSKLVTWLRNQSQ